MVALKGAIRDFYKLLTGPRTVSNTYAQVARAQSCANHEQHVVCHVVRRDSKANKFDRIKIAFIFALFILPGTWRDNLGSTSLKAAPAV